MIEIVPETGSTNSDLLERLRAGSLLVEGDWLVADRQISGRGRQGRRWSGGLGNFMGSTAVRCLPSDPPAPTLALLTGLVLHEVAAALVPDPLALRLKWPNDLLYGRAKLAGILLEGQSGWVVVGVGVNLAHAPELPDRETCSFASFGPAPDRNLFAEELARTFSLELDRWRTYGLDAVLRRWQAASLPVGTRLTLHDPDGQVLAGAYSGLTAGGSLLLRLPDGATHTVHAGEVTLAD